MIKLYDHVYLIETNEQISTYCSVNSLITMQMF